MVARDWPTGRELCHWTTPLPDPQGERSSGASPESGRETWKQLHYWGDISKNTFETTQSDLWWEFSWKIHITFSKQQTSNQNRGLLEELNVGVTVEKSYILNSCPTLKQYWTTTNITVSHNKVKSICIGSYLFITF